ncbi:MAG: hypothetical protein J1F33_06825 [Clostridiales bacterium]|nr:hypothetical protein [Clostridiales bacterium]
MNNDLQKYESWRAITESDFVTMFIKTWFAFVATLRELYPDIQVFDVTGKPRGDRPFTNEYKQSHLNYISKNIDIKEFTNLLYDLYLPSRINVAKVFPQYFFTSFYRMNEEFHYVYDSIEYSDSSKTSIKDRIHIDMIVVDRYEIHGVIQINGKYNKKTYFEQLKFKINVKSHIDVVDCSRNENIVESEYLKFLYSSICNDLDKQIDIKCKSILASSKQTEQIKTLVSTKLHFCANLIRKNFSINFDMPLLHPDKSENEYRLIVQRPFNLFSEFLIAEKSSTQMDYCYKCIRDDGAIWFIDFVVSLRNALFHEIIDPLNELWQKTFKAAYLLLKKILDLNINFLRLIKGCELKLKDYINAQIEKLELPNFSEGAHINTLNIARNSYSNGNIIVTGTCMTDNNVKYEFEALLYDNFNIKQFSTIQMTI